LTRAAAAKKKPPFTMNVSARIAAGYSRNAVTSTFIFILAATLILIEIKLAEPVHRGAVLVTAGIYEPVQHISIKCISLFARGQ
jgi:hypothetical protein